MVRNTALLHSSFLVSHKEGRPPVHRIENLGLVLVDAVLIAQVRHLMRQHQRSIPPLS